MTSRSYTLPYQNTHKTETCVFRRGQGQDGKDICEAVADVITVYFDLAPEDVKLCQNYNWDWEVWIVNPNLTPKMAKDIVKWLEAFRTGWYWHKNRSNTTK